MVMHQREFTKRSPASTPVPSPYLALHPHALTSKPDITGPHGATTAIIDIYDIFGFSPQTIQGADILSTRLNALVLLPDFFHGDGAKHEWLPADTEEKMSALMGFVESKADFKTNLGVLGEVVKVYRETFSGVKTWGALGLCWGGKVSFLFSFFGCWLGMIVLMCLVDCCLGFGGGDAVCCYCTGSSGVGYSISTASSHIILTE